VSRASTPLAAPSQRPAWRRIGSAAMGLVDRNRVLILRPSRAVALRGG
jgi:hypothetical protein